MSFHATLNILNTDIKNIRVLNVEYEFNQPVDHALRPKGKVQSGLIVIEIESSQSSTLAQWMFSDSMQHSGQLVFDKAEGGSALRTLNFTDAFCIYYKEIFNASDQNPMRIVLKISARMIELNNIKIENHWPERNGNGGGSSSSNASLISSSNEPIKSFNPLD